MLFVICRCRQSADFSLKCAWLLGAYSSDAALPSKKKSHGTKLKNLILSDELRPKDQKLLTSTSPSEKHLNPPKKTHQRSQSDATGLLQLQLQQGVQKALRPISAQPSKLSLGDLSSGRAFDNGCVCFETCQGVVNDLRGKKTECTCSVGFFLLNFIYLLCVCSRGIKE